MTRTLLSFGHGYCARALAARLMPEGWRVIGTTRTAEKADAIRATGAEAVIWPGTDLTPALDAASHVLISAGPDADGDPVLRRLTGEIRARAARFAWAGYLSTTGVYGDRAGGWVDENAACDPAPIMLGRRVR